MYLHKDYDDETYLNDIALLRTARPMDLAGSKGFVNGICLPSSNKDPEGFAKVIGWGHTMEGKDADIFSERLLHWLYHMLLIVKNNYSIFHI